MLHHQLIGAPWRTRKKPVARRNEVLATLVDAGAELIVSGHIHQATAAARHEFEIWSGAEHGAAVAVAPGLGQPRPKRRGEARGLLVHDIGERELRVQTYVWRGDAWGLAAERLLLLGRERLAAPLLAQRTPRAQPQIEVVENLCGLVHCTHCIASIGHCL